MDVRQRNFKPLAIRKGTARGRRRIASSIRSSSTHCRRGSTYAIVLMASLIVVSIGLSSLASVRIQARIAQAGSDTGSAKRLAMAGLEYGLLYLNQDVNWRTKLADAGWSGKVPMAGGTFTMTVSDPMDADLLDTASDSVVIRSVGEVGTNRHLLEARFEMEPADAAINAAIFSAGSIAMTNATINADAELFAAGNSSAFNSNVNANIRTKGTISGATYNGSKESAVATGLVAPNNSTALAYYLSNGTTIPFSSLPLNQTNLITNGDLESGLSGWTDFGGCELEQTTDANTGSGAIYVKNRDHRNDGPVHSITLPIVNGDTYRASAWVKTKAGSGAYELRFHIRRYYSDGSRDDDHVAVVTSQDDDSYVLLEDTFAFSWDSGTKSIDSMTLRIETVSGSDDFTVDDVSFTRVCGSCSARMLSGRLITPAHNTIGGGTNAQGIYIIDCANQNIIIENSRINGTLVLRNPGTGSEIRGSMNMEAAVQGYPTLMVDGFIKINTTTAPLTETAAGRNLNPSGAEYPLSGGTSDADTADSYPSHFQGIVFSTNGFTFNNQAAVNGTIIANNSITFDQVSLTVTHDEKIAENPPPGFTDVPYEPHFVPGSFKRIVE